MDYSDDEWVTSSEVIESSRRSAPSVATKAGDKRTDQAAEYITPEELDKYCRAMDSAGLVQRLATVYKNAEAYLKIREIETSKLTIEVRLCEQLHDCPDPGVFILVNWDRNARAWGAHGLNKKPFLFTGRDPAAVKILWSTDKVQKQYIDAKVSKISRAGSMSSTRTVLQYPTQGLQTAYP